MSFAVTPAELLNIFGLTGVVYFPRYESPDNQLDTRTADFLSQVGLPHDETFKSKASVGQEESILLTEWFTPDDGTLPEECHPWLVLGYFTASVIALAPLTGKVYAFGEGEPLNTYTQLHRDVESLVHALNLFKEFEERQRDDQADIDEQVEDLRARIHAFDATPFEDDQSQWNLVLDEVIEGVW
ncbi:SUKH-4 family immunity protein [Streptomyces sp. M2CJ-2]|uniref:SUKH-4 family immunity protein n=1 Tax=Streptomyces sp. M2CJ-2 TaxID=2803948 RepID=UPI00192691B6|nr:SUKH-4 family immunity protein [Streptomyces sp. M2CJ-2]MBL3669694.1 SUKH-4 family immunity protein [Streptomyces sp. M2CJ-2]